MPPKRSQQLYDSIGAGYSALRRPDARITRALAEALADSGSVCNVGAGAGSYEPRERVTVAVEPSATMLAQRAHDAAPAVQATASALPFADGHFAATMALLTVHHWSACARGLDELARCARERVVVLTWDPDAPATWLDTYFPELVALDRAIFPRISELQSALGSAQSRVLPIPYDCVDGFFGAYWRRPERYLDARARRAISSFAKVDCAAGLARLAADVASGLWARRFGELDQLDACDVGYRIVVADVS